MAITSILNQVLSETDLLRGWSPIFQYQWDAILCTLGFVLANALCPPTPSARKSLQTAISTLDLVSDHFLAAKNAAQVVREVSCQADRLIDHVQQGLSRRQGSRSQSISSVAQNGKALSTQNSFVTPGQSGQSAPVKWALPPTAMDVSTHQSMPSFEARVQLLDMIPIGSLPELSPTMGTTESLSGVLPSATSGDMVAGTEAQWMHASAMILDSWTTNP
jgi:hypothetical protein